MSTLFKAAISITKHSKPFLVQVAIPDGVGKFIAYDFRFSSETDAILTLCDYFNIFRKHPEKILAFHEDTLAKREANLELPFFQE